MQINSRYKRLKECYKETFLKDIKWYYKYYEGNIQEFFDSLERWFSYLKVCFSCYDFDFSSILLIEQYQIKRVRDSIQKYHSHVDADRDVERMNTAIKLLDIVLTQSYPLQNTYVNIHNAKRFGWNREDLLIGDKAHVFLSGLREIKAWHIYNEFRKNWLLTWWD